MDFSLGSYMEFFVEYPASFWYLKIAVAIAILTVVIHAFVFLPTVALSAVQRDSKSKTIIADIPILIVVAISSNSRKVTKTVNYHQNSIHRWIAQSA